MKTIAQFWLIPLVFGMMHIANAQSITLDPTSTSTVKSTRNSNYFDIDKTGSNSLSGLRFSQNQMQQGGLFFSDDYNVFNLSNNSNIAGIIWNRTSSRAGIGTFSPDGKLHVLTNSTAEIPHLTLQENSNTDGARIQFANFGLTARWTLYGSNANTPTFNIFHSDFGNVAEFKNNGNTELNGFTKLGIEAPKIKMKKFTGTTPDANTHTIALDGIDFSKILSYEVLVEADDLAGTIPLKFKYKPSNDHPAGYNYRAVLRLTNLGTNPTPFIFFSDLGGQIKQKPFSILVTFEE
ncbi:hypothetical protein GVN20_20405 [Runella sp. CRIBMP]|uniref:Uncharacterized protein n=1 Tax=Runella aurantiaca TaxID=2282308 RepID=A0A369IB88_9BACT|nr:MULTISPECIES: hypothetical protein [Runella]NBB21738.1 hypothetical protein [Runella sp. CRIBMP]RDB05717.1 hypothetical protein DVG78_12035 [Runella aurantiaca]